MIDKIKSFKDFKDGWNYGEGVEFKESTIEEGIKLINLINNIFKEFDFKINCFPGINGEIEIVVYLSDYVLDLFVEEYDRITFCLEENDKEIEYTEDLSLGVIDHKINNFKTLLER